MIVGVTRHGGSRQQLLRQTEEPRVVTALPEELPTPDALDDPGDLLPDPGRQSIRHRGNIDRFEAAIAAQAARERSCKRP